MRRELGQLSLADGLVAGGAGRNRQLERIAALVDWAGFERLLGEVYAAPVGRPSYGPVVLMEEIRASTTPDVPKATATITMSKITATHQPRKARRPIRP